LGETIHLNRPGKKHNSGLGLLPIAITKINKKMFFFGYIASVYQQLV